MQLSFTSYPSYWILPSRPLRVLGWGQPECSSRVLSPSRFGFPLVVLHGRDKKLNSWNLRGRISRSPATASVLIQVLCKNTLAITSNMLMSVIEICSPISQQWFSQSVNQLSLVSDYVCAGLGLTDHDLTSGRARVILPVSSWSARSHEGRALPNM